MGMRGVIAYCLTHGDNIFFPMGTTGHLRRKRWYYQKDQTRKEAYGLLQYGNIDQRMGGYEQYNGVQRTNVNGYFDDYRPMAYNLPDQEGACYWIADATECAVDFNYGNYMTAILGTGNIFVKANSKTTNLSDALPIRPVLVK